MVGVLEIGKLLGLIGCFNRIFILFVKYGKEWLIYLLKMCVYGLN